MTTWLCSGGAIVWDEVSSKEIELKTWKYQTIVQRPVPPKKMYLEPPREFYWEPEVDLDAMGEDGWELVSVTSIDHGSEGRTSELRFYFKKEA